MKPAIRLTIRPATLSDLSRALNERSTVGRSNLLHNYLNQLLEENDGEEIANQERMGSAFGLLRQLHLRQPLNELNIAAFACANEVTQAICAFALVLDIPVSTVASAVYSRNTSLLLILCRSQNFAWSTVKTLLSLYPSYPDDRLLEMERCNDYHALSIHESERLFRLVKVHLHQKSYLSRLQSQTPAQTPD